MADGFADLIEVSNRFFAELKVNNTREWFQDRKDFYNTDIKKPAELLADLLAEDLNRLTGNPHKPKLFRIHRDVRFSKDKTPYNPHLHFQWSRPDTATAPNWFLGSSPDYLIVAMGVGPAVGEGLDVMDSRVLGHMLDPRSEPNTATVVIICQRIAAVVIKLQHRVRVGACQI